VHPVHIPETHEAHQPADPLALPGPRDMLILTLPVTRQGGTTLCGPERRPAPHPPYAPAAGAVPDCLRHEAEA
jgi:hypothetical protein